MIEEKDIREIYEIFYRIAEEVEDGNYTESIAWQLHNSMANPGIGAPEKRKRITSLAIRVDKEYFSKFRDLEIKQRRENQK